MVAKAVHYRAGLHGLQWVDANDGSNTLMCSSKELFVKSLMVRTLHKTAKYIATLTKPPYVLTVNVRIAGITGGGFAQPLPTCGLADSVWQVLPQLPETLYCICWSLQPHTAIRWCQMF